jgi:hypothetical protein
MKASAKQAGVKKLVTLLKKRYGKSLPKNDRPVLETIVYAACLENTTSAVADENYARLSDVFHDLNEIRVSSISELASAFTGADDAERRALKIRSSLQYIFEKNFQFEFEAIKKKTHDLANKHLGRMKELSAFVKSYTLQAAVGSHILPIDDRMCAAAIWLGLLDLSTKPAKGIDLLKPAVRKPDAPLFCHLLRCLATDEKLTYALDPDSVADAEEDFDLTTAPDRLAKLFIESATRKPTKKKPASKKPAAKKITHKKPAAKKTVKRAASKAVSKKKPAKKKVAVKKVVKKTLKKKVAVKKVVKKTLKKKVAVKKKATKKKTGRGKK